MDNSIDTSNNHLIQFDSNSEKYFVVLFCLAWANMLFNFVFVLADKILNTGFFMQTGGKIIVWIILSLLCMPYFRKKIRLQDIVFCLIFILLFFFSPSRSFVTQANFEMFTQAFFWAIPLYFMGISLEFSKNKKLFALLAMLTILVGYIYNFIFVLDAGYTGSTEFQERNMTLSYEFLLPTMYMIWYTFSDFKAKSFTSWINLCSVLLGIFAMSMLGTRGSVVAIFLFLALYLLFFKVAKHKIIYGFIFLIASYLFVSFSDQLFTYLSVVAVKLGFSDRVFLSFLSDGDLFSEGSSGRDAFYPVLFSALKDSPISGYGLFGPFRFIGTYSHNIIMEILVSFGFVLGGLILLYGVYSTVKAFCNHISDDEKGFLFVLFGGGIIGLFFSFLFFTVPSFFLFLGYCIQLAYRRN